MESTHTMKFQEERSSRDWLHFQLWLGDDVNNFSVFHPKFLSSTMCARGGAHFRSIVGDSVMEKFWFFSLEEFRRRPSTVLSPSTDPPSSLAIVDSNDSFLA